MTPTMRRYLEGRLFEWVMALSMVGMAVQLYIWPSIINASAFLLLKQAMPETVIASFIFWFGLARVAALVANGRSLVYGPLTRAVGAVSGAVLWAQFTLALVVTFNSPPAPGIPFWILFVFAELYSAYRAVHDVRD